MLTLRSRTTVLLAEASLSLSSNNYGKTMDRLDSIMQQVTQNEYPAGRGRAFALQAQCKFQELHHQGMRNDGVEEVADWLQRALCEYKRIGSLQEMQNIFQRTVDLWDTTGKYDMVAIVSEQLNSVKDRLSNNTGSMNAVSYVRQVTEFIRKELLQIQH